VDKLWLFGVTLMPYSLGHIPSVGFYSEYRSAYYVIKFNISVPIWGHRHHRMSDCPTSRRGVHVCSSIGCRMPRLSLPVQKHLRSH
jgi:hypothetical protein